MVYWSRRDILSPPCMNEYAINTDSTPMDMGHDPDITHEETGAIANGDRVASPARLSK